MVVVGIAMLQGARHLHIEAIQDAANDLEIDVEIVELRTSDELSEVEIDGLLLPGGESTVMRLTGNDVASKLLPAIFNWIRENKQKPVLATCAGAILLADPQDGGEPLINAEIDRNAYGGQSDSFEAELDCGYPGVFIRAPRFTSVQDPVECSLNGEPVGVRRGNRIALTFHPELSGDLRYHRNFLEACQ
ncbi:MAG: pyridoxal 5'-phosphate synthase glutaminase subunit PdxT [Euryarchaeota archaeon]|nr:pyridoxal 5'-phosphate synthase glutaminase subunit PdxT [Euryarchaeota archaeon]MED5486235.1 pyridoxal 5'-phosphate synthase glutaminase subunit PdxT [Candidatus Thermoplasmatota archaeon]